MNPDPKSLPFPSGPHPVPSHFCPSNFVHLHVGPSSRWSFSCQSSVLWVFLELPVGPPHCQSIFLSIHLPVNPSSFRSASCRSILCTSSCQPSFLSVHLSFNSPTPPVFLFIRIIPICKLPSALEGTVQADFPSIKVVFNLNKFYFRNCALAFRIAEQELNIPALLDPKVKKVYFPTLQI